MSAGGGSAPGGKIENIKFQIDYLLFFGVMIDLPITNNSTYLLSFIYCFFNSFSLQNKLQQMFLHVTIERQHVCQLLSYLV